MEKGISTQAAIAIRKEHSHSSEMVSQLLYNELYTKLDEANGWTLIRTELDQYEGWIWAKQHHTLSELEYERLKACQVYLTDKPIISFEGKLLSLGTPLYSPHPDATAQPVTFDPELMVANAKKLLEVPYIWGGRTVMGIDCSGLVQICARTAGLILPRDASQQSRCGEIVYFLQETQPGDLAFFGDAAEHITHVGIVISNEQIIHASGKVRIDYLDQTGIFNKETGMHTHHLQHIMRL